MEDIFFGPNKFIGPETVTKRCGRGGKGIKVINTLELSAQSQQIIFVECKHGQRAVRWYRRSQLCKQCAVEAGLFNTSPKGRKITWGDKISKAKKGIKASDGHKKALSIAQYGVAETDWPGFYEKSEIAKIRDSIEYIEFRRAVMARDAFCCTITGMKGHLEVHHLDGVNLNSGRALDVSNAVTLHKSVHSKFHLIYGAGDNTKEQFENFKRDWSKNRPRMIFLCGQSGSGKTTLAGELVDKFNVISYDACKSSLDAALVNGLRSSKTVLLDIPMLISTLYKKYQALAHIDMVFLIEENSTVDSRLINRGSKLKGSKSRSERIRTLAKKYSSFTGNYEEVLAHLKQI
jgi:hypothetical protein